MQKKGQNRDKSPMNLEDNEKTKTKSVKKSQKPFNVEDFEEESTMDDPFQDDQTTLSEKFLDVSQYGNIKIAASQQDMQKSKYLQVWKPADQVLLDLKNPQPKNSKTGYFSEHEQNEIEMKHNNEISKLMQNVKMNFADEVKVGGGFRYYRSPENAFKKKDSIPNPTKDHKWMLYFNLNVPLKFDPELSVFKFSSQSGKPCPALSPELSIKILEEIVKLENIKENNKNI